MAGRKRILATESPRAQRKMLQLGITKLQTVNSRGGSNSRGRNCGFAFWPVSVGFWFARFHSSVVIGENEGGLSGKEGVCRPVLPQINFSKCKSTVDLRWPTIDLGLGLAGA